MRVEWQSPPVRCAGRADELKMDRSEISHGETPNDDASVRPMTEPAHPLGRLPTWLLMAALTACSLAGEESSQAVQSPPVPVGVIEAQLTPVNLGESFVRRIEAVQKVEVRARVTGFIEARLFEEGQFVEVGVPLFHIEKDTYEAVVRQRQADLAAAEAESVNARAQLDRAEALAKGGNIAQEALEERRAAAQTTAAAILQARAALRQAEIALGYTDIHAPLSGLIGRAAYDVGDLVGPDSGPLTEIISRDPIYAVFPISQRELVAAERQAAEHGQDRSAFVVRIRFADGSEYPHPGKVDFVGINQWC